MELQTLYCPNCSAPVEPIDGLDTFYCPYCGYKIQMSGVSNAAYRARTKVKRMEHKEHMQDKKNKQNLAEKELEIKKDKQDYIILGAMFLGILLFTLVVLLISA